METRCATLAVETYVRSQVNTHNKMRMWINIEFSHSDTKGTLL